MEENYWQRTLTQRISRRRALAVTGGTAAAAALLAACGGGSSSGGGGSTNTSSLVAQPTDTTKQAKRGGTINRYFSADFPSLDPMMSYSGTAGVYETVLGRLVGYKPGFMTPGQEDAVDGDLAESWEYSPDHLQITLKMRQGVKFHPVAPVNGRLVDTDDVLFTWKRFTEVATARSGYANAVNPDAPVLSITAPDTKTIVIKLKEPIIYALSMFGARENVNITPKEADGGYDPRSKMISIGPYYISDYQRSVGFTLKRHPDFYNKDFSFADQLDYPIVSEYATAAAQFRAGAIHNYPIKQEEVVGLKSDLPAVNLYQGDIVATGNRMIFGWKTPALRDERVRQAFSMSYDRDLWIEVWNNASKFESQGLPVERRWYSPFPAINQSYDGWRLEPRDAKDFGPNAKFFQHDVAGAKQLLAAAGFPNGLDVVSSFVKGTEYGVDFQKQVETRQGMNADAGIRFQNNPIDYQTEFIRNYRDSNGNFEGVSYRSGPPALAGDPVGQMTYWYYSKAGPSFFGFDAASKGDMSGDPYVDQTIVKAQQELDTAKRQGLITDLVKYLGQKMYSLQGVSGASTFNVAWPAIQNYFVYRGNSANTSRTENMYWWVDATKAPLA